MAVAGRVSRHGPRQSRARPTRVRPARPRRRSCLPRRHAGRPRSARRSRPCTASREADDRYRARTRVMGSADLDAPDRPAQLKLPVVPAPRSQSHPCPITAVGPGPFAQHPMPPSPADATWGCRDVGASFSAWWVIWLCGEDDGRANFSAGGQLRLTYSFRSCGDAEERPSVQVPLLIEDRLTHGAVRHRFGALIPVCVTKSEITEERCLRPRGDSMVSGSASSRAMCRMRPSCRTQG
jgi:hypothetical protein